VQQRNKLIRELKAPENITKTSNDEHHLKNRFDIFTLEISRLVSYLESG
jgi:hypothetical protein